MNINEEMKLHKWAQDMADQKSSGLSQEKWCKMKGIPTNTFQYRCKRVRIAMEEKLQGSKTESASLVPVDKPVAPANVSEQEPFFATLTMTRKYHCKNYVIFTVPSCVCQTVIVLH